MAYFAKVEGNKVVNVILADQSFIDSLAKSNPEQIWREGFLNLVGGVFYNDSNEPSEIQPTGNFRKNTPKIGMFYDQSKDVFYEEKPFESWSLNEDSFIWSLQFQDQMMVRTINGMKILSLG